MLTIHIITVGSDKDTWISDQIEHYRKLIGKYARLEFSVVPEGKYGKSSDIKKALETEAKSINARIKGGYVVVLDLDGKSSVTRDFADKIARLQVEGNSCLEFVIGGPHGIDESIKEKADLKLRLSPMTMSHQIVRLVLLEQLYRVLNLNAGGSYHK
jgi:23S rRNA (pseudouridine1915-N3)-methyltransferase